MAKTNRTDVPIPSTTLRHRAEAIARMSPTDIAGMTGTEVQSLIYELQIRQIELELQNEELRHAQVELDHSRDQYSDLYEFAPTGYVTLDSDGKILNANLTTAAILGVERQHLLAASLSSFVSRESQDEFYLHRQALLSNDRKQSCEVEMRGPDAKVLTVRLESIAFGPRNQRRFRTALIDVTQRKVAEETLRLLNIDLGKSLSDRTGELQQNIQQVRLLTEAVSHLGEGVLITSDKPDWPGPQIVFVNEAMCEITGYMAAELTGQSPRFLLGDESNSETSDRIKADLSAGRSVLAEMLCYRKDGTTYDAELFITAMYNDEGRRTHFVSVHRDITKRKRAEEALRREHELSEAIIESSQHIILLLDTKGRILRFNQFMVDLTGYRFEEVYSRDWFETFIPARDQQRLRSLFERALVGELSRGDVNVIVTKDGREIEIEWFDAPLTNAEGQIFGVVCTGQDITERRRAGEALRDREERLRAILNTAADAIITIDHRGIIDGVNAATGRLFGYTDEELIGQNVSILMPWPYCDEHDEYIRRYIETGKAQIIGIGREVLGQRKDGSTFPVGLAVSEINHLRLFTGIIRDISEQRKLQRDVVSIADDEQRRIGQDLHDSTQQELAGMGMLTQTLFGILTQQPGDLPTASVEKCCEIVQKVLNGLKRTQKEVQSISRGLIPIRLDPAGLMDALRELASRTDGVRGISCAFKCEQPVEVAESFTATHLYRIAQEAITNALKHAQPEYILIALESDNGQPILQVADDGTGFDSGLPSEGMGLKTMRYRASLIGANLAICRLATGGTLVTCKVFRGGG